jgi:hypothetical protein
VVETSLDARFPPGRASCRHGEPLWLGKHLKTKKESQKLSASTFQVLLNWHISCDALVCRCQSPVPGFSFPDSRHFRRSVHGAKALVWSAHICIQILFHICGASYFARSFGTTYGSENISIGSSRSLFFTKMLKACRSPA